MSSDEIDKTRLYTIYGCIRCLDCEQTQNTIEYIQSPVSIKQRELVKQMMRKNENDQFILEEIARIFGKHSIIKFQTADFSNKSYKYNNLNLFISLPILYLTYVLIKKGIKIYKK